MGQAFGSTDGLDPSGKALGQNATPDQLGISGGQAFARKALQGSLAGLGKGLQQPQGPQQAAPPINVPQAPLVDPRMFTGGGASNTAADVMGNNGGNGGGMFGPQRPKNPFYGN